MRGCLPRRACVLHACECLLEWDGEGELGVAGCWPGQSWRLIQAARAASASMLWARDKRKGLLAPGLKLLLGGRRRFLK